MNGVHDCGGMHGMGQIKVEANEPTFHHDWEKRVFGMNWAIGANGYWNQDEYRHAMENRPAADYLADSYFAKWLFGLEQLLVQKNIVTADELLAARGKDIPALSADQNPPLRPAAIALMIQNGYTFRRDDAAAPRFRVGDTIIARNINISGHTRLPRYIRCKQGVVTADHGVFSFNDSAANEHDEKPQHVYSVRFMARELWGPDAPERDSLQIDMWDDYMDLAPVQETVA